MIGFRMKKFAIGFCSLFFVAPVFAQVALKSDTPSILFWTPQQQADGYRNIENIYKVVTVKRGAKVHPLPKSKKQLSPAWEYGNRQWTVDSYMKENRTSGVLVLKDGKIVLERYGLGRGPQERWTSFSVAKSLTSTLVGAAIQDGKIAGPDDMVTKYVPELKGSAYEGVTVRQLLMMSSGVKWNEDYTDPKSDVAQAGFTGSEPGMDPLVSYMRHLPRDAEPGTKWHYDTGETDMVGIMVANAVGESLSQYLSEKIWSSYGMEQDAVWMVDASGKQERGGCCISMTLRDYARVGQFILDGGKVQGRQVVPSWWIAKATSKEIDNGASGYGYFWWMRENGSYEAVGIFGQSITTFRDERLIVVINSAWPVATSKEYGAARTAFINALRMAAK
ncbi:MAG TPA: serine hydrolase [Steroidobacteraceae bacterium]|jgi:CubicO group peptidase (beta-lactamase class C family)|nr:serine hydrolase [Steroidobacteraceae bacterium]